MAAMVDPERQRQYGTRQSFRKGSDERLIYDDKTLARFAGKGFFMEIRDYCPDRLLKYAPTKTAGEFQ